MKVGTVKEIKTHEYRVGLAPASSPIMGIASLWKPDVVRGSASTMTPTARPAPTSWQRHRKSSRRQK